MSPWSRRGGWPKAMVAALAQASTPAELEVKALLDQYAAAEATKLQEGLLDPAGAGQAGGPAAHRAQGATSAR